jgi:protein phosphatase
MTAPMLNAPAGPRWRLSVGFVTHTGMARERNEDAFALFVPYEGEGSDSVIDGLFAVADGMGGHAAGDVASRFVTDAVTRALTAPESPLPGDPRDLGAWLERLLHAVNRQLRSMAADRGLERGMGSTLTLAVVCGQTLQLAHVGDSRCYRLRAGVLEQLTEDHSWVAAQLRAGLLDPEEAEHHPQRNLLTQCLGIDPELRVFLAEHAMESGDRYLLCSDGLHGQVTHDTLAAVLPGAPPQDAAQQLIDLANAAGGPDNITALVFEVRERASLVITMPDGQLPAVIQPPVVGTARWRSIASRVVVAAGIVLLAGAGAGAWLELRPAAEPASPAKNVVPPVPPAPVVRDTASSPSDSTTSAGELRPAPTEAPTTSTTPEE